MSYGLDPSQDRRSVGPDLDSNRLRRLPEDDKIAASKERVKKVNDPTMIASRICI